MCYDCEDVLDATNIRYDQEIVRLWKTYRVMACEGGRRWSRLRACGKLREPFCPGRGLAFLYFFFVKQNLEKKQRRTRNRGRVYADRKDAHCRHRKMFSSASSSPYFDGRHRCCCLHYFFHFVLWFYFYFFFFSFLLVFMASRLRYQAYLSTLTGAPRLWLAWSSFFSSDHQLCSSCRYYHITPKKRSKHVGTQRDLRREGTLWDVSESCTPMERVEDIQLPLIFPFTLHARYRKC